MSTKKELITTASSLQEAVDAEREKREVLVRYAESQMILGTDYHEIKGKKSLGKPGAEKICSLYGVTIGEPELAKEFYDALPEVVKNKGAIVIKTKLYKGQEYIGAGIGARTLLQDGQDLNKSMKMARKSSIIDATLSTFGLSDLFTQDIEDMGLESVGDPKDTAVGRQRALEDTVEGEQVLVIQKVQSGVSKAGKEWSAVETELGRFWNNSNHTLKEGGTYKTLIKDGAILMVEEESEEDAPF